jgi:hypothetical protein
LARNHHNGHNGASGKMPAGPRPAEAAELAETLRGGTNASALEPNWRAEAGVSMFWRVFGGTILSIAALAVITLYNHLNTSLAELRRDVNVQLETRAEYVKKAELEKHVGALTADVKDLQASSGGVAALTERAKLFEQQLERQIKQGADERKDLTAGLAEHRKLVAAEHRELFQEAEALRRALEDERKDHQRRLEELRKEVENERRHARRSGTSARSCRPRCKPWPSASPPWRAGRSASRCRPTGPARRQRKMIKGGPCTEPYGAVK